MERVIEALKKYNKFLIVSHVGLEGDSIGCQLALENLLIKLGKKTTVVNGGSLPKQYDFLGIEGSIGTDLDKKVDYDAAIVLDCPVIRRVGEAKALLLDGKPLINIDHHISNNNFGDVNWVQADTSSCGEMVYKLFRAMDVPLDQKSALYLYVAILTDTGSFAYENTTSNTHHAIADLIEKGVNPPLVYKMIYENKRFEEVELLKDALATLKLDDGGKISYMYVSKKMLNKYKLSIGITEGFINYARSITNIKVAIFFMENPLKKGRIQISFRSKGDANVDKIAALFGGGGHKNASGCTIEDDLKSTMKTVLSKVREAIAE